MARKKRKKLRTANVEDYLREHYQMTNREKQDLQAMKIFFQETITSPRATYRFMFRMVKVEVIHMLIEATIQSLLPRDQEFLHLRFTRNDLRVNGLEMRLNLSASQLNNRRNVIYQRIIDALDFRLTIDDVFFRNKIINMMEALAQFLEIIDRLDPDYAFCGEFYPNALEHYYNNYSQLLRRLDECVDGKDSSTMNFVVATTVAHPFEDVKSLVDYCKPMPITPSTIQRYQHTFEQEVAKYVFPSSIKKTPIATKSYFSEMAYGPRVPLFGGDDALTALEG